MLDASGFPRVCFSLRGALVSRAASAAIVVAALALSAPLSTAVAETISGALAKAYVFSPDLGQQRAAGRAADEGVPRASSGFRPTIAATSTGGATTTVTENPGGGALPKSVTRTNTLPRTAGLTVTQTLYNGNRTANGVRQAESVSMQTREQLRLTELNVLNAAATSYMNVLRDTALVDLNQSNVRVLEEQLKQSDSRFKFGEITRTDVAQSQAALAQGQAGLSTAIANLHSSLAVYRQLIGEPPKNLAPAKSLEGMLPHALEDAIDICQREHPQIQAALHAADAAELNVKVQESALYPTATVQGSASKSWDALGVAHENITQFSAIGSLNVPLYDGGQTFASIRQAKEQYGQARLQVDLQREAVRATVVSAWGVLASSRSNIRSFQAQVRANEVALDGVRQEAKLGQRTTLDVLNAQQTLLNSRVSLVSAQRDLVVNSYNLVAAMGRLSAATLGLNVDAYDPALHFDQVKDQIWGVRIPDGR